MLYLWKRESGKYPDCIKEIPEEEWLQQELDPTLCPDYMTAYVCFATTQTLHEGWCNLHSVKGELTLLNSFTKPTSSHSIVKRNLYELRLQQFDQVEDGYAFVVGVLTGEIEPDAAKDGAWKNFIARLKQFWEDLLDGFAKYPEKEYPKEEHSEI